MMAKELFDRLPQWAAWQKAECKFKGRQGGCVAAVEEACSCAQEYKEASSTARFPSRRKAWKDMIFNHPSQVDIEDY